MKTREIHYMKGTPEYTAYTHMKQRCTNPNNEKYQRYGGRGITVCQVWMDSFVQFYRDMGDRPEGMSIDRIDNDGNYEAGNCRWATAKVQRRNTSQLRLTPYSVSVIKWLLKEGYSRVRIAAAHKVSHQLIGKIDRNETWTDVEVLS